MQSQAPDNSMEMLGAMMQMMEGMNQQSATSTPTPPQMPQIPEVIRTPDVDWTEKLGQLTSKSKADYALDRARKVGRTDTIHTSPLLDEDE